MDQKTSFLAVAVICGIVLFITLLKRYARFVLQFLVRAMLGGMGIFWFNGWLENQGILLQVGINPISLLTSGSLGISGVLLLYLIEACKFL